MPGAVGLVSRAQPVVPFGFLIVKSKPPSNQPQVMLFCIEHVADIATSHLHLIDGRIGAVIAERIGVADHGDRGLAGVAVDFVRRVQQVAERSVTLIMLLKPLACPETRLMAPGDDGPNCVV